MSGYVTPPSLYPRDAAFVLLICCQANCQANVSFSDMDSYKHVSFVKGQVDLYLTTDQWKLGTVWKIKREVIYYCVWRAVLAVWIETLEALYAVTSSFRMFLPRNSLKKIRS
jgi:hypothetical protein